MIFPKPKAYSTVQKKYPSQQAIAIGEKIVQVGPIMTKKEYNKVMKDLKKQYPQAKETDFIHTFVFGKDRYYAI